MIGAVRASVVGRAKEPSLPGYNWRAVTTAPEFLPGSQLVFSGGWFVATTSNQFVRSLDGETWSTPTSAGGYTPHTLVSNGNGLVVAGGASVGSSQHHGSASYSTNHGSSWTLVSTFPNNFPNTSSRSTWGAGTTNNSNVIVFGNSATTGAIIRVAVSHNSGDTWAQPESIATFSSIRGMAYGGNRYVAIRSGSSVLTATSNNVLSSWTTSTLPSGSYNDITYGNGRFVIVGSDNVIRHSASGTSWGQATPAEHNTWNKVTYAPDLGMFLAVASTGTNRVMLSFDGINWEARPAAEQNSWHNVAYGNGRFVAISGDGTNRVMVSP